MKESLCCGGCLFKSIKGEVPQEHQAVMRNLYLLWLWSALAFFWNGVAILIAAAVIEDISFTSFLLACLYFGLGLIGSWKLWYRNAYNGSITGSSRKWLTSFFGFGIHIAFCGLMTVGPPNIGAGGIIVMFDSISENGGVTICLVVSSALWGLATIAGVILFKRTHTHYRDSGGKSAQQAGQEVVQMEVRRQVKKEAERQVQEAASGVRAAV